METNDNSQTQEIDDILNEIESLSADLKEVGGTEPDFDVDAVLAEPEPVVAEPGPVVVQSAKPLPPPLRVVHPPISFAATPAPAAPEASAAPEPPEPTMSGSALLDAAIEMDAEPGTVENHHENDPENDQEKYPEKYNEIDVHEDDLGEDRMEPNSEEGSLTMTLKGNMTLKLNYECAGQSVTVSFSEDALRIQMADGAEFKIPVHKNSHLKAA